ncbi:uncharacterized protein LOC131985417 [Centropristis striata]|uniref:uncharacterized protein LOC131985417 n=1 Tax=Centropristis striata TaxID=184440 RepID=UPI0027DF5DBE|nr:uncharacterized protein LOC131985417 [Centropristis striata]
MGSRCSKAEQCDPNSPIIQQMKKKYGPECCECLPYWIKKYRFPKGGSLSKNQLEQLRTNLQTAKDELMKKGKVKTEKIKELEKHVECLNVWEDECEHRERKQGFKTMTLLKAEEESQTDKVAKSKIKSKSSLYPSLTGHGGGPLSSDTLLDLPPPFNPPADAASPQRQPPPTPPVTSPPTSSAPSSARDPQSPQLPLTLTPHPGPRLALWDPNNPLPQPAFSPIADHTRSHDRKDDTGRGGETFTLPMVQVMGHEGAAGYVYRPWTVADLLQAAEHLPKATQGGQVLGDAVMAFIRDFTPTSSEMGRVMMRKLSGADFAKIRRHFTDHVQPSTIDWQTAADGDGRNAQDVAYRRWMEGLVTSIKEAFPLHSDLSKVNACTQKADETPEDYVHRLQQVFDDHSGIPKPRNFPGDQMSAYESLLKQQLLNGLSTDVCLAVKDSCIGHNESSVRLADVVRHANHAYKRLQEKTEAEKKTRKDTAHRAQLQLLHQQTQQPQRGRGHYDPNICFNCGGTGHWARDCPYPKANRGRGRGGHGGPPGGDGGHLSQTQASD